MLWRAGEPQALRPEGAVDVMSHLLCRNSGTGQEPSSRAEAASCARAARQASRVDEVDARPPQLRVPAEDRLAKTHPREAAARPAAIVEACPRKIDRSVPPAGDTKCVDWASHSPDHCASTVLRSGEAMTRRHQPCCLGKPAATLRPAACAPVVDRRLLVLLLEEGRAGSKAAGDMRAPVNRGGCGLGGGPEDGHTDEQRDAHAPIIARYCSLRRAALSDCLSCSTPSNRSPCSATRRRTASIVNAAGSSSSSTSSQRSGVETGAPGLGRTE